MKIGTVEIGKDHPPFIVAEMGAAHNGQLPRAMQIMRLAAEAGANAVKFQAFTADSMTIRSDRPEFKLDHGPWAGRTLWDLYSECAMPREWYPLLFEEASRLGIALFASVFSPLDADILEGFGVPAYKIASAEITDVALIRHVFEADDKPVIISTGMVSIPELERLIAMIDQLGGKNRLALLHCSAEYPADIAQTSLWGMIPLEMRCPVVGFSDHTIGSAAPAAASFFGAQIIEKHITLSRDGGGPDDGFAATPDEFAEMVTMVHQSWVLYRNMRHDAARQIGDSSYAGLRRSLYVVEQVTAGELLTEHNVRAIRPGNGIHPEFLPRILGSRAVVDIAVGTPLSPEMFMPKDLTDE